ncbi:MAG: recombinase family protein [Geminicoccaceae bacterium]
MLTALEEFDHLGVRFVSVQDQIDTSSPMGRAMFTIIGAMAELESSLISERVTAGMRAAKARGRHLGRPATPQRVVRETACCSEVQRAKDTLILLSLRRRGQNSGVQDRACG